MLKSLLLSALSACLAVWGTLQYQQRVDPRPSLAPEDTASLPPIPTDDADSSTIETDSKLLLQQEQQQEQQQQQQQEEQQELHSSSDIPASIDLAQALGLGRVLLARGEPEESALAFRVAAAAAAAAGTGTNQVHAEAKHGLGLALQAVGRPKEALEACQEAEQLDPALAVASACVGALLTESGDILGALKALRSAAEKLEKGGASRAAEGTAGGIHGRLGAALLAAGEVDEAISVLTRALEGAALESRDHHASYNLGVAWQIKGNTDKSIAAYAQAVELAPTLAPPRVNLGAQLLQSGRLPEAEAVLLTAVKLGNDPPSLAAAHSNLGAVLRRSGRAEEALESYSQAVRWGAGRSSLMHIAKIHQELGHPQEALQASQRAMKEAGDPLDTSLPLLAGLMLETLGDLEEAAAHFAAVTQIDADNLEATMHLGSCQQRLGRHHEALDAFLKASRLEPKNHEIYELLLSAVGEAKSATGIGNPDVGDDRGGGQDPEGRTGAVGTAVLEEAKDKGAAPPVFEAGHGAERSDAGGVDQSSGSVVEPPEHGAGGINLAGRHSTLDSRSESVAEGGNERHGQHSGEDATAFVAGTEMQEVVGTDVAGVSNLGADARSGSADTVETKASTGVVEETNEDHAQRGADAIGGGGGSEGVPGDAIVDTDAGSEVQEVVDTFTHKREGGRGDAIVDTDGGNKGQEVVDTDVAGVSSLGVDVQGGSVGSVSTKASPDVAGASVREAAAEMRKRSDSLSHNDAPETPPRGFFVARERHTQDDSEDATGAEGAPSRVEGGGAGEGPLDTGVEGVPATSDEGVVLANTATTDESAGGEDVEAEELVLPRSTVVLPGGDTADENAATPAAGASVGVEPDSGSEGSKREGAEEAERIAVGVSAHSDMDEQSVAKTPVRVTDDREAGSPASAADERDKAAAAESAVDSSEVAEAASEGALAADEANGRDDGVIAAPFEGVPPVEGLGEDVARESHALTKEAGNGGEDPADVGNVASSTGISEKPGDIDAIVREKDDITPTEDKTVSGDASESPGRTVGEQTVRPVEGGVEQAVAVEPSITGPVDLKTPDGADGGSVDGVNQAPGKPSNQSSPAASPEAASETPEDVANPVPVTNGGQEQGAEEEGRGTATVSEASDGSAVAGQEAAGVGEVQGKKVEGGVADEQPAVASSDAGTDVAGASGGDNAGVDAPANVETGDAAVATVSEEEGRRARSKAKLGLARLQKGQTKKAVLMFEKAASIDPGWWGGFYYTALGQDDLGNAEAAARALVSALSVDAPTEAGEVAELAALTSKVLASLDGEKQASVLGLLKTAMDASGLAFAVAPAPREQPLPGRNTGGDSHDPASGTAGGGGGVGRAASMRDGAQGSGTGLEADLAHLGKNKAEGTASPSLPVGGKGAGLDNPKKGRWPFSGTNGPAGRTPPPTGGVSSASRVGEAGTIPGSNRGAVPGMARGEASPPAQVPAPDDPRGVQGLDNRAERRDTAGGDASANPDVGRRRGWGRPVGRGGGRQSGGGNNGDSQFSQNVGGSGSDAAAAGRGGGSTGGGTAAIDSKASAEEIWASMGLKSGLSLGPDGLTGGVAAGAKTPAERMAESSGGGGGGRDADDGGKQGLFGRLWNGKKAKRKER